MIRKLLFLPSIASLGLIITVALAFWFLTTGQAVFISLVLGILGYIFRRSRIPFTETLKPGGEIFLSPVHGKIESVRQNVLYYDEATLVHEVRISISIWDEKGLYLPTSGEVSYLKATKGKKVSRAAEKHEFYGPLEDVSHTDMTLTSKTGMKSILRFVDAPHGQRPVVWLKSGDRGRGAACFGYYPLGGTLLIYLPPYSDILVYESEHVVPGKTVIADIKEVN